MLYYDERKVRVFGHIIEEVMNCFQSAGRSTYGNYIFLTVFLVDWLGGNTITSGH